VQAILLARIERLSPEHKRLLQAAAVVGKDVPYPLLHAIDELPEKRLREGLTALQRGGFLYDASRFPDLAYTFKHALTHEVAYSALGQEQRRSLHSKVLHAIERLYAERLAEQLEQLGYHSFHAEAWDKAVAYLRQSGEKAYNRSASREAMVAYDQALAALAHLPKTRETLEQAVDLRLELRNVLHSIGEFGRLFGCLDDAERLAQALGDQRRVARVLGFVAFSSTLMGDHDRAIASGERALAIAEAIHDLGVQVVANNYVGLAYFYRGNYPRAIAFHRRNLACLPSDLIRERFGLPVFPTVLARAYVAWSSAELGQFTDGIASGEHGVQTATALDQPFSQIWAEFSLGYLYLRKGDLDKAAHILERALDRLDRHHIPFVFPFVASLLGATRVSSGQLSEGLELLEHALEVAVSMKNELFRVLLLGWLSEGYSLTGRTGDAFEHAQHALKLSRDYKERGWEAWTLRLLGEIASCRDLRQFQDAKDSYQQALAIAKELRMEPLVAHCQLGLGKLYRDTGQPEQASGHMATATKMYEGMHMESWMEKTKGALR
jgi:tetratricopeptide (TPR) repeat protein